MGFPILDNNLCGCGLKTSSKFVSYLSLLESVILIIRNSLLLTRLSGISVDINFYIFNIITSAILLISTLVLYIGISKERINLILQWNIIRGFHIIVYILLSIFFIIKDDEISNFSVIFYQLIWCQLWLVVFSQYWTVKYSGI